MAAVRFPLVRLLARFRRAKGGNVTMLFALAVLPITLLAGAAIDYTRATSTKSELLVAADAAALAAVVYSVNNNLAPPDSAMVKSFFNATLAKTPNLSIDDLQVATSTSATSVFATVSYTARNKNYFMGMIGVPTTTITGSSKAAGDKPLYVNFALLLDNSPSMGLGATAADITKLQSLTPDACAFACHQHTYDSQKRITGDLMTDYYHIAKANGVQTRIDVLRTAVKNLASTAQSSQKLPGQFQMSVAAFSDVYQQISGMTTNLTSGVNNVQTLADGLDLAYAYYDQRDTQTAFDTALYYANAGMTTPGDGSTQAKAASFLFIVTDGVSDQPVKSASGSGDTADVYAPSYSGAKPTVQPNISTSASGNVNGTRLIRNLDPSLCDTVKNRGIRIAVLYTPYMPVTNNGFYNSWVAPILSTVPTNLKSCASPGFYFEITPTQGINEAMQAMFLTALSKARLTN